MIPYPYNMVDMGGIDLAEANGTVVEGLYAKIVEAVNACGDVVLYNWKFAGIEIVPQHTSILLGDPIIINGAVQVTEQDLVTVPGINPDPPPPTVLVPLSVTENGQFSPQDYDADGFSEVDVSVHPSFTSLVWSKPTMADYDNTAGEHTFQIPTGSEVSKLVIVARGAITTEHVPIQEISIGAGTLPNQRVYLFDADGMSSFTFTKSDFRVCIWCIQLNRPANLRLTPIAATAVAGQNAKYEINGFSGFAIACIYNSNTNENNSASWNTNSILTQASDKALRFTYAILSEPVPKNLVYTINVQIAPADGSNYIILVEEE